MQKVLKNKYLLSKIFDFARFGLTLSVLYLLIVRVPEQMPHMINVVAAFVLGSAKIPPRFWLQ